MKIEEKAKTLLGGYRWVIRSDDRITLQVFTSSDSSESDEFMANYLAELSRVRQELAAEAARGDYFEDL